VAEQDTWSLVTLVPDVLFEQGESRSGLLGQVWLRALDHAPMLISTL
jgi:hypothetical protein